MRIRTNWGNELRSVQDIITGDTSPRHNAITRGGETAIYLTYPAVSYPQPIHSTEVRGRAPPRINPVSLYSNQLQYQPFLACSPTFPATDVMENHTFFL